MESLRERIIKYVKKSKKIDEKALDKIDQNFSSFREFKENLIKENIVNEEEILLFLSREYKIPYLDLDRYRLSTESKELMSKELSFRYKVLPISKIGQVLTLATSNPLDIVALDDLSISTNYKKIELVLAKDEKIIEHLNKLFSETDSYSFLDDEEQDDGDIKEIVESEGADPNSLEDESQLAPIVRIVDLMIYEAIKRRSSDIHIEPTEDDLMVRYRIDGVLHHGLTLPKRNQSAIIARLKIMSTLNITEFRVPQDGRFKIKLEGREIDFRVSSLPTNFGEKIVLRILDRGSLSLGLKKLGFSDTPLELFDEALRAPFGIILVTGPTGSGKSTTLYSIVSQLNTVERNIITIEDPVEYQLEGITQVHVRAEVGLSFASTLRSVLRQSPDIVMVGEIRDAETADVAIKASLTGQFILSTLHTNNAVGAITRLIDMGTEPFLVASSVIATTAQRLVRSLCPKCKIKEKIENDLLDHLGLAPWGNEFFAPKGCTYCNNTGYRGRIALLEVLSFDDTIRELIIKRTSEEDLIKYAREKRKFSNFKEDGFNKCKQGLTSIAEVLRVAG